MKPHLTPSVEDRLYRISVNGGTPEQISLDHPLDEFECALTGAGGCVLRETAGNWLVYYGLDPVKGKGPEIGRTAWLPHVLGDWCVSPDGSSVALASHDAGNPRIRIVPLGGANRHEQEVMVKGFGKLSGINFSADGQGWYVAADTGSGTSPLYVSLQGETHVLLDSPAGTWGVPSPDGKKLAFVDQPVDSNVWMWQAGAQ